MISFYMIGMALMLGCIEGSKMNLSKKDAFFSCLFWPYTLGVFIGFTVKGRLDWMDEQEQKESGKE